ncbi:MAG TPA: hypothetical protein VGO91_08735 [Pyrinomonadaceae bacterium]|jgi:hypothetical protein|nr:hypothetical protein [Pyrinomonadaceae bacterium]
MPKKKQDKQPGESQDLKLPPGVKLLRALEGHSGERLNLPKADEPIQLTQTERRDVEEQRRFAARRSRFEQAVFQFVSYVESQKLPRPECFISYAWGDRERERWVERNLATDCKRLALESCLISGRTTARAREYPPS